MASQVEVTRTEERGSLVDRLRGYVQDVRQEMGKVSWPTRRELLDSTIVVIVAVLIVAAFIGVIDRILNFVVGQLFR